jgi:hypothetical protein
MPSVVNALIHCFDIRATVLDDEGCPMLGCYYQFIDTDDEPVSGLIGPYGNAMDAQQAARRAYRLRDF